MRSLVVVGAVFGVVAPALAQAPQVVLAAEAQPRPVITDEMITASIKERLEQNKLVRNVQVTVFSRAGFVTLVGTVPDQFARDAIMEATRATPGVLRIDDQLRFEISSPSAPARSN